MKNAAHSRAFFARISRLRRSCARLDKTAMLRMLTVMVSRIWKFAVTCRLYLCIIFSGYLLFVCRPKRGILSSLPAELEITGSVEVTDCFSRMFITSPRPNDQPLCHAVLVSLKLNVKMSSEGKHVYSSYFNLCEILETTSSTM